MLKTLTHFSSSVPIRAIHYSILVSGSLILSAFPVLAMEKAVSAEKILVVEKKVAPEKICAIYPHLKDSYWLSVNYGMIEEAKKQRVELKVLESGGYPNIVRQTQQIQEFVTDRDLPAMCGHLRNAGLHAGRHWESK